MTKIQYLRQLAHTIKTETKVGGNTADRVGSAFEGVADALEGTEQIAEMDKAVQEVQQQVEASKAQIQSLVNALPVVQQTGDSTTSVMSQKAVSDKLNAVDKKFTEEKNRVNGELEKKLDKESILQESGDAEDKVMSQNATTTAIADETTRAKAAEKTNAETITNEVARLDKKIDTQKNEINTAKEEALQAISKNEQSAITNFNSQRVTPEMLSESTKQLIEASGGGTITNLADDEDLTSVDDGTGSNVLKFADRAYNADNFSGKGYKILRKNIKEVTVSKYALTITSGCTANGDITITVNSVENNISVTTDYSTPEQVAALIASSIDGSSLDGAVVSFSNQPTYNFNSTGVQGSVSDTSYIEHRNVLTKSMINQPNTIYEIRYDYDLNNQDIILAKNSEIKYTSGSISNGQILYNNSTKIVKSGSSIKDFKNLSKLVIVEVDFIDYVLETDIVEHNGIKGAIVNNVLSRIRESFYSEYQLLHINIPGGNYIINGPIDLTSLYLDFNMSFIHVINTQPSDTIFYWSSPVGPITPNLVLGGVKNIMQVQQYSDIDKVFDLTNYNGPYGIENIAWISIGGCANYGLYQPYISNKQSYSDYKYLHKVSISIKRYDDFPNKDIVPYNILCLGDGGKIVQCGFKNLCLFGCGGMTVENCENLQLILAYSDVDILSNYCEFLGSIKIIKSNVRFIGGKYRLDSRPLHEKYKGDFIRVDVQEDIDNFKDIVYPLLVREGSRKIPTRKSSIVDFGNIIMSLGNWHYLNSYAGFIINKGNYCKFINLPIGISVNNDYPTTITYCNSAFNFIANLRKATDTRVDASFAGTDFSGTSISYIGAFVEIDKERMLYNRYFSSPIEVILNSNEVAIYENVIKNYNNTKRLEFAFNALPLVFIFKINDEIFYGKKVIGKESSNYEMGIDLTCAIHKSHYMDYEYTFGDDFLVKDDGFYKDLVENGIYNNIICYNSNYALEGLNKKDYNYNDNGFNAAITVTDIKNLKKLSSLKNGDIIYEKGTKLKYEIVDGALHNITQLRGSSSNRPTNGIYSGFTYYDTTLKKIILWNGTKWVNIDGTELS